METQTATVFLTAIGSLNLFVLTLLLWQIKAFRDDIKGKVDKKEFIKEADELWKRVHGHKHNGEGRVVIVTPGGG